LELLGVDDKDLKLIIKDLLFNFTIKQVLESLGDPGILAEVARFHTLIAHVPIYTKIAQLIQELSNAFHKFQGGFNEEMGQVVFQFKATKKRVEEVQVRSYIHMALMELI
jgi:hypothetical protein